MVLGEDTLAHARRGRDVTGAAGLELRFAEFPGCPAGDAAKGGRKILAGLESAVKRDVSYAQVRLGFEQGFRSFDSTTGKIFCGRQICDLSAVISEGADARKTHSGKLTRFSCRYFCRFIPPRGMSGEPDEFLTLSAASPECSDLAKIQERQGSILRLRAQGLESRKNRWLLTGVNVAEHSQLVLRMGAEKGRQDPSEGFMV